MAYLVKFNEDLFLLAEFYEKYSDKVVITLKESAMNDSLSYVDLYSMIDNMTNDQLESIEFYEYISKEIEERNSEDKELSELQYAIKYKEFMFNAKGYSNLISINNNKISGLITIIIEKPTLNNLTIDELLSYIRKGGE